MKSLLRTLILLLIRVWGVSRARRASRRARHKVPGVPRILLVRPDHLGDMVITTPVLQALRSAVPAAHITMMVGPWSREIVARHPAVDQIITCPFPGFQRVSQNSLPLAPYLQLIQTARQLRRDDYDLAINLRPDFWWGAALLYLASIPRRVGYAIAPGTPFLTAALAFITPEHASVSSLRLTSAGLQTLGYHALPEPYTPERYPAVFTPTAAERQWVAERLQASGIDVYTHLIVIHTGTGAQVKLWRNEAWASLAARLAQPEEPARHIVLTGTASEQSLLQDIARAMDKQGAAPPLLITDATVGQLAALLGRAQMVLGVDNGPLHLAVAQDVPTLQIFGPTDTRIFGPWGASAQHKVIASTQRCATCPTIPCGRLDFSPDELAAHPCVRLITENQVEEAITALMHNALQTK